MPAGRHPVPGAVKEVRGNPGRRQNKRAGPKPAPSLGKPPAWLSERAREHWDYLFPILSRARLLSEMDELALAMLCQEKDVYVEASKTIASEGSVYSFTTEKGGEMRQQDPFVGVKNSAYANMLKLMDRFGMSPSMREKVSALPGNEKDPFEEFLKGDRKAM